jgi:threonylcarbamoyladenosine tRNA methylthiotransferase MtaB
MVRVITVGCRLNQAEGNRLANLSLVLEQNSVLGSDLVIVNTCAVTREATSTSWKMIRRCINNSILKNKNSKLIVTGCLATIERDKMLSTPGIDAVITQKEKVDLLELNKNPAALLNNNRSRPNVKIQDGCPNQCSFCIACTIRGKPKSVVPRAVLDEITVLSNAGYQEIVLTGLNLGSYGIDIDYSLAELLESFDYNSYRIRLSSIEPETINDELLNLWQTKRLCRHLHIPLQSGDDKILKQMQRKYTVDEYRRLFNKVFNKIPDVNIGADVIVGFPGEDEPAFNNTLKLIEELPFGYLHVFPYSPRPGTESAKFIDNVKPEEKKERVRILREISIRKRQLLKNQFINRTLEVVAEENNIGLTDNYIRISIPESSNYQKGHIYNLIFGGN